MLSKHAVRSTSTSAPLERVRKCERLSFFHGKGNGCPAAASIDFVVNRIMLFGVLHEPSVHHYFRFQSHRA